MVKNFVITSLLASALLGCDVHTFNRAEAPSLFDALDTQPNGHTDALGSGATFKITGTKASNTLLCRTFDVFDENQTKSYEYCKIKGGEWR